jgi:hypothetical protein
MLRYVLSGTTRCALVLLTFLEGTGKTYCGHDGGAMEHGLTQREVVQPR